MVGYAPDIAPNSLREKGKEKADFKKSAFFIIFAPLC